MTAASAAVIKDGSVVDYIVVDVDANRQTAFTYGPDDDREIVVLPDGSPTSIGWAYSDGNFYAPLPA